MISVRKQRALEFALFLLLLGALFLRVYHIAWDQGYLFHPDERQILFVVDAISFPWPPDWGALLTPASPLNPKFFAYGSFPIYLLRGLASLMGLFDPDFATLESSYLVGRVLSALFDVGTLLVLYHLGRKLYDRWVGLLAVLLVALTVLHVQLAHFYAVDTLLTFFVMLTLLLCVDLARQAGVKRGLLLGVVWGMALATKVSAAPLGLPVALAWLVGAFSAPGAAYRLARWRRAVLGTVLTGLVALVTFVFLEPYALIDVGTFLGDVVQESQMARGVIDLPYTRQFIGTLPYLYPIYQAVVWSLGVPLGLAGFGAALAVLVDALRTWARRQWQRLGELSLPLAWFLVYFGITGSFHAKFLRYMLPVIPLLCLWAAWALLGLIRTGGGWRRAAGLGGLVVVLAGTTLYLLAFLNIYREEHPWVQATAWLCRNLPRPSRIMLEHWDDALPMRQGTGALRCYRQHNISTFGAYYPDDTEKLETLLTLLEQNDYIILASNRLYNTIPRLPERYPLTSRYYQLLLGEQLGFELVYYKAVYPALCGVNLVHDTFSDPDLPQPRLYAEQEAQRLRLNLGRADESYSVYDHPMPLVFKKTHTLSRQELLDLFGVVAQNLPPPQP